MAITVMDANQLQKKMNGKVLPIGWWHYLRRNATTDRLRVGFLGVILAIPFANTLKGFF